MTEPFRPFRSQYEYEEPEEGRSDVTKFCPRLEHEVLIIDSCCFSRARGPNCDWCIYDQEAIKVKLIHVLLDMLEDSEEQRSHAKK